MSLLLLLNTPAATSTGPTITNAGSGNSIVSSTTLDITGITASVGDTLVVIVSADNAGAGGDTSTASCADAAGNTYDLVNFALADPGTVNVGVSVTFFMTKLTSALSAQTVTVTFSPATVAKAAVIYRIQPSSSTRTIGLRSIGAATAGDGIADTSMTLTATNVAYGDIMIGGAARESTNAFNEDTDTTNGTWSTAYTALADTGTNATSVTITAQYKITTAIGDQTYNVATGGATPDMAMTYIILYEYTPIKGLVKYWNGTSWSLRPTKVWGGSTWAARTSKVWNGTSWLSTGSVASAASWSTIFSRTHATDDTGWTDYSMRNILQITGAAGATSKMRISIRGHSTLSTSFENMAMGISTMANAADTPNNGTTTTTPVPILFSGSASVTLAANELKVSDEFTLGGFTATSLLVFVMDFGASLANIRYTSGLGNLSSGPNGSVLGYAAATNSYNSTSALASAFNGWIVAIEKIEVS